MIRIALDSVAQELGPEAARLLPWIQGLGPVASLAARLDGMVDFVQKAQADRARLPLHLKRIQGDLMPEPIVRDCREVLEETRSRVRLLEVAAALAARYHERMAEQLGNGEWPEHLLAPPGPEPEPEEQTREAVAQAVEDRDGEPEAPPETPLAEFTTAETPARRGRPRSVQASA